MGILEKDEGLDNKLSPIDKIPRIKVGREIHIKAAEEVLRGSHG